MPLKIVSCCFVMLIKFICNNALCSAIYYAFETICRRVRLGLRCTHRSDSPIVSEAAARKRPSVSRKHSIEQNVKLNRNKTQTERGHYTSITTGSTIGLRWVRVNRNWPIFSRTLSLACVQFIGRSPCTVTSSTILRVFCRTSLRSSCDSFK